MTGLLLYLTLTVTGLIVLVLAFYLVAVIAALWSAKNSLAKLAEGLAAIRDNTQPLPDHMRGVNGGLSVLLRELAAVNGNLEAIVRVAQNKG